MVGVLRLLHGKANQVITGNVDVGGRGRIQGPWEVARDNRPVHRLITQFDTNFGAVAIDELCGLFPTNEGHVVTRHQKLGPQQ